MPRRGKFWDKRSDQKSYGEGKHESKKAGFWSDVAHDISKGFDTAFGDTRSRQEKGYDAGWEEGVNERTRWRKEQRQKEQRKKVRGSYSSDSSYYGGSSDDGSGVLAVVGVGLFAVGIIIGGVILCANNLTNIERWAISTSPVQQNPAVSQQRNSYSVPAKKETNCDEIIQKRKANKKVKLPKECKDFNQSSQNVEQSYSQANKTNLQPEFNTQRQISETQNQQKIDADKRAEDERLQKLEYERQGQIEKQRMEEGVRNYNALKEKERQQAEADRIKEEEAERKRQQARDEAAARNREKQRRTQENNDQIIRLGTELKDKIFKRKN